MWRAAGWRQGVSRRRGPATVLLCVQIACFAAAVPLLARLGLPRLRSLLAGRPAVNEPDAMRVQEIIRCVGAVLRLAAPMLRPTCLTRGLTLYHFLRRAGFDVALCFGAGYPNGEFAAHCWLVHAGQPYMEPWDPLPWFTEVYRLPPGAPAPIGAAPESAQGLVTADGEATPDPRRWEDGGPRAGAGCGRPP